MCDNKYEFSYSDRYLTDGQRKFYEENGYLLIRKLVNCTLLDECNQRFEDICNSKVKTNMILVNDGSLLKQNAKGKYLVHRAEDLCCDEILRKFVTYKSLVDVVESVIGPNISAALTVAFNKPPNADPNTSGQPLHQDLYYSPIRPVKSIVTVWTAAEKIDENNGCLYFIPGSHKVNKVYEHFYPKGLNVVGIRGVPNFEMTPKLYIPMEKGDTLLIHPLVLHGSAPNRTKGFRRSFTVHYTDSNAVTVDLTGTPQETVAKEFLKVMKAQNSRIKKYEDLWTYRSYLIRGTAGNIQKLASSL